MNFLPSNGTIAGDAGNYSGYAARVIFPGPTGSIRVY